MPPLSPKSHALAARADALDALVARARTRLDTASEPVQLRTLARELGVSSTHLLRGFRARVGVTPSEYQRALFVDRVRVGLRQGKSVTQAGYDAGFGSSRALYEATVRATGRSPRGLRSEGEGELVSFALTTSALGLVALARSARGVIAVLFGPSREALIETLRAELPRASLTEDEAGLAPELAALGRELEGRGGPTLPPELALDPRGTPYEARVWRALLAIPRGTTKTYGELARELGSSPRAVGRACGRNRIAVLIPCHRVVATSGALTGYRFGLPMKQALLERERDEG
jgi:AraC family transcriptional regulator of adaptative response/methylated-DNA-[protein]-cysteine methyltransferase